jgi:hypothetical protein
MEAVGTNSPIYSGARLTLRLIYPAGKALSGHCVGGWSRTNMKKAKLALPLSRIGT